MRNRIEITDDMKREARVYADLSRDYTSRKHDFHLGGADEASYKMNEGKIGEKAFKKWLIQENIPFTEDKSNFNVADNYDFLINGWKVDVKTRTQDFHTRTLEMVEQFYTRPKDIYIGARYYIDIEEVQFYGAISAKKLKKLNQIENNGYIDNLVAYDNQLAPMQEFKEFVLNHKK